MVGVKFTNFFVLAGAQFLQARSDSDEPSAVVVDDECFNSSRSPGWKRLSPTANFSCDSHGWKEDFVFSEVDTKASSALHFSVNLPKVGCYLVEEFHPLNCKRALSKAVELQIDYCYGRQFKKSIDQTDAGNRWNPVAMLPFYGPNYNISLRSLDGRIAVADAFRYTYIAATCAEASSSLSNYSRLASTVPTIVSDDSSASKVGSATTHTCSDALMSGAHTVDDGPGSAEYLFEPPSTGCYRVDEFHPSSTESCPLASTSQLHIEWCKGGKSEVHVDLSIKGGQWNTVSHFMFYAGITGKVKASRTFSAAKGSLWAADAFRFTKVSEECSQDVRAARATVHITGVDLVGPEHSSSIVSQSKLRFSMLNTIVSSLAFATDGISLSFRRGSVIVELQLVGASIAVNKAATKLRTGLSGADVSMAAAFCSAAGAAVPSSCQVELLHLSASGGSPFGWPEELVVQTSEGSESKSTDSSSQDASPVTKEATADEESVQPASPRDPSTDLPTSEDSSANSEVKIAATSEYEPAPKPHENRDSESFQYLMMIIAPAVIAAALFFYGGATCFAVWKRNRKSQAEATEEEVQDSEKPGPIAAEAPTEDKVSAEAVSESASTGTPADSALASDIPCDNDSLDTIQVEIAESVEV